MAGPAGFAGFRSSYSGWRIVSSGGAVSFSRVAWGVSTLYMALAAYVSWREGTFTSGSVTMGFMEHGGMWGDFIILPIVNGLIVPCIPRPTVKSCMAICGLAACAVIVTVFAHAQWDVMGRATATTDFVFPRHSAGVWYGDMSLSGFLHLAYMSVELTLVLAYVIMPMPVRKVLLISGLLTVHLIVGQVQPGWYTTGTIWTARTIVPTLATVLLTWLVALYKIRQANRCSTAATAV